MPTLADIANEVNNKLSQIVTNTKDTADTVALVKGDTADIKLRIDGTNARLDAGFSFLGEGLFAILEVQRQANAHLATLVDQNDVMLCWMAKMAELLCQQLRVLEKDLAVHEHVLATMRALEGVVALVHAREKLEYQTKLELEAKISACCPRTADPPKACYEPCREPEVTTYDPKGQDWDGSFGPNEPDPIG